MPNLYILNKLKDFQGDRRTILEGAPEIVLKDICMSYGIKYEKYKKDKLIEKILNTKIETSNSDLRLIARYVNANEKWKSGPLLESFEYFYHFNISKLTLEVFNQHRIGLPSIFHPKSINPTLLYSIYLSYYPKYPNYPNYPTVISIEEMTSKIISHLTSVESKKAVSSKEIQRLKSEILLKIVHIETDKVIELASLLDIPIVRGEEKVESFEYTYDQYQKVEILKWTQEVHSDKPFLAYLNIPEKRYPDGPNGSISKKLPDAPLEAIALAAINYEMDISNCRDPLSEYEALTRPWYFPSADILHFCDNNLDKVRLNKTFNPSFPEKFYKQETLISLLQEEGEKEIENCYEKLQIAYLTEEFVAEKGFSYVNTQTTFLEKLEDLGENEVVSFGVRGKLDKKGFPPFKFYTYGELADTFSSYRNFVDPISGDLFSKRNIDKLYFLAKRYSLDLQEEIERIRIYLESKNEIIENFLVLYETLQEKEKEKVNSAFTKLLQCAMYMRSWVGEGPYPLKSVDTNFPSDKQIIVDYRVTKALVALEKALNFPENYIEFIKKLPLIEYTRTNRDDPTKSFRMCSDYTEGLTIFERIKIVKKGGGDNSSDVEASRNMNSCIRLSSNKFCATAYYYMLLLNLELPFDIDDVSNIS